MMVVCFAVALVLPLILGTSQRLISQSAFEWGTTRRFNGILQIQPYPHLLVRRPGKTGQLPRWSTYYLVAPWKFGLNREALAPLDGKTVTLKGTLIYRGNQTMIETKPEWMQADENNATSQAPDGTERSATTPTNASPLTVPQPLGRQTLVGEIVDSKCFFGVMNPGQLTPHRACAIRCISGGVPPVLLVRKKDGSAMYLLLVSPDGRPVNQQILDKVAEPVEITGEVERQGDLFVLRADPATFRRVE